MTVTRMVITISREEGSGGREIAQELASKLKLAYIDDRLIRLATQRLNIPAEELAKFDEKILPRMPELRHLVQQQFRDMPLSPVLAPERDNFGLIKETPPISLPESAATKFENAPMPEALTQGYHKMVEWLIREIAQHGHAVIVGRGANFVLKGWTGVINIHVTAPLSDRIERVAFIEHLDKDAAARQIAEVDTQRAAFIQHYYGTEWTNPDHYHMVVNTSQMPLSTATIAIAQFVKGWSRNLQGFDPLAMHLTYDRLAAKDNFTVKEVSELLLISPDIVRQAVYQGEIKGTIMNHNITRIKRAALLDWLRRAEYQPELRELTKTN